MAQFNLNQKKFIYRHIREGLRKPARLAWLETLSAPLEDTLALINQTRDDKIRELSYNGQTVKIESVLNYNFDPIQNRIYILQDIVDIYVWWYDDEDQADEFLFYEGELSNGTFGTSGMIGDQVYLKYVGEETSVTAGTDGTSGESLYDFIVVVPSEYVSQDSQIRATVNKYKNAGRRFNIQYV